MPQRSTEDDIHRKARLAFGLVLLALAIGGISWYLVSAGQYTNYRIYTRDSVSGLIADAPIEFHGIDVGKVSHVELMNPRLVGVTLSIRKSAPITAATVATITSRGVATRGFTGYVYVSLEDADGDSRQLSAPAGEPYPVIRTAPSKVVSLDMTLDQVNENVQILTRLVQSVLDARTVASLKQSVDSLQQITKTLADNNRKLGSIIVNGEQASREIKPLLESSNNMVNALQTQILPEAYKTLSNLQVLSGSLMGAASKISRDPSVVIRGAAAPQPGPGETK
jgi:phospholipid/cholesterol/gamma-HCH transport system substrate-binding protein